jgi:chaperone modulatory protein CbpM
MAQDDRTPESGLVPEETRELTIDELSHACAVQAEFIVELVEEGVLAPAGGAREVWRFSATHLRRVRVASHLQRDLGVNVPGVALALELLDELRELRERLAARGGD